MRLFFVLPFFLPGRQCVRKMRVRRQCERLFFVSPLFLPGRQCVRVFFTISVCESEKWIYSPWNALPHSPRLSDASFKI